MALDQKLVLAKDETLIVNKFIISLGFLSTLSFSQFDQIRNLKKSELRKPSLFELRSFLSEDKTKDHIYDREKFNCVAFSLELRDNARDLGLSAGYVSISFENKNIGHALNVFDVPGEGLIYIDPQSQSVAYLRKGELLGFIPLGAVREEISELPEQVDEFNQKIEKIKYGASIFSYGYFKNYQLRRSFLSQTIAAFNPAVALHNEKSKEINAEVLRINEEVFRYNRGQSGDLSLEEIHTMQAKFKKAKLKFDARKSELDKWKANIESLEEELQENIHEMPEVADFVIYW